MLTDSDIRCLHHQISAHFPGCSHTEARPLRVFLCRPLQYLPSVRRAYSILCLFVTVHLAAGVQGHNSPPSPAHPSLEWMTPGTPEDSHLAVAPLHFSLPLKHNSELPHRSPNKCYSSCIFNLLTDAIILYTPCSLILMQLLLFIAGRFSLLLFHLKVPLSQCVCVRAHLCAGTKALGPIRTGQQQS